MTAGTDLGLTPFKHCATRHRIPEAQCCIWNWPAHDAGLGRRGNLTLWVDEAALASSVLRLLGLNLAGLDHTTLSRRDDPKGFNETSLQKSGGWWS